jgi:hypothetical protein
MRHSKALGPRGWRGTKGGQCPHIGALTTSSIFDPSATCRIEVQLYHFKRQESADTYVLGTQTVSLYQN